MDKITLTAAQAKSRRNRNIALGVVLGVLVVLFYAITVVKISGGMNG